MSAHLICGEARRLPLADGSIQCVVTSPPYWGLRKYAGEQELVWGGNADCLHEWAIDEYVIENRTQCALPSGKELRDGKPREQCKRGRTANYSHTVERVACVRCGAWLGAYGLEPRVEMYVQHTVEILRDIRRVLREDGVCFLNLGDSYASQGGDLSKPRKINTGQARANLSMRPESRKPPVGLKPKDLCLIPQRVALAAQQDGWWIRSDIIWSKPNPMPESVRDRPTDAYEHILMLTKSARYYWDAEAVGEPSTTSDIRRPYTSEGAWQMDGRPIEQRHGGKPRGG